MNKIRAIQALNKKEIENGISPEASWHVDYRDTAYVYFGGLPYSLSEGDIITIFSQFGEPVFLKLVRDKESGKSKGFGWLKYEDQRSTDLAVDNLGGAEISGRLISVDHARYKKRDDESDDEEGKVGWEDIMRREGKFEDESEDDESDKESDREILPEEKELMLLIRDHDDDDPMKGFLIEEKKKEVQEAKTRSDRKSRKHKDDRHRRPHRSRREHDVDKSRQRSSKDDGRPRTQSRDRDRERRHRHRSHSRERESREKSSRRESERDNKEARRRHHDRQDSTHHDRRRNAEDRDQRRRGSRTP